MSTVAPAAVSLYSFTWDNNMPLLRSRCWRDTSTAVDSQSGIYQSQLCLLGTFLDRPPYPPAAPRRDCWSQYCTKVRRRSRDSGRGRRQPLYGLVRQCRTYVLASRSVPVVPLTRTSFGRQRSWAVPPVDVLEDEPDVRY
jgi:hypothetical protein